MFLISRGIVPDYIETHSDTDRLFEIAEKKVLNYGLAGRGDRIIVTAGIPAGRSGTTNLLKVIDIG